MSSVVSVLQMCLAHSQTRVIYLAAGQIARWKRFEWKKRDLAPGGLIGRVDSLMSPQAILPFVSFPTMKAHESRSRSSDARVGFVTWIHTARDTRRSSDFRDVRFVKEVRRFLVFSDVTSLSLQHP